jgi:hypothetical protein
MPRKSVLKLNWHDWNTKCFPFLYSLARRPLPVCRPRQRYRWDARTGLTTDHFSGSESERLTRYFENLRRRPYGISHLLLPTSFFPHLSSHGSCAMTPWIWQGSAGSKSGENFVCFAAVSISSLSTLTPQILPRVFSCWALLPFADNERPGRKKKKIPSIQPIQDIYPSQVL